MIPSVPIHDHCNGAFIQGYRIRPLVAPLVMVGRDPTIFCDFAHH